MAAIVLAGGRSSRMGRDKALLRWQGRPLIETVIARAAAAMGPVLVIADSPDRYALGTGVRVEGDQYPGAGPLGGIVTGLSAAGAGIHIVVACDMPDLQPALLRLLCEQARGWDAAVPEIAGRLEPLCAAYSSTSLGALRASLESGNRAVHRALAGIRANVLPEALLRTVDADLASLRNINTPDEYEKLRCGRASTTETQREA